MEHPLQLNNIKMKAEEFNQWSGLKEISIPKGKQVKFKLLGIFTDPEPANKGRLIVPNVLIRPTARIFKDNKAWPIAAIAGSDMDGTPRFHHIVINGTSAGVLTLKSGVTEDEVLYQFLKFSDENESNPDRNTDVEPKFYELDEEKTAEERIADMRIANKALELALSLSDSQINIIAEVFLFKKAPSSVRQEQIIEKARKSPSDFMKAYNDAAEVEASPKKEVAKKEVVVEEESTDLKDIIRNAFTNKILTKEKVDSGGMGVFFGSELVLSYDSGNPSFGKVGEALKERPEILKEIS